MGILCLPHSEVEILNDTISAAIDLVEAGFFARGYDLLLAGLGRARARQEHGDPWGQELVGLWGNACDIYCASYGVSLDITECPVAD
jgi:hypothetical protein